MAGQRNIDVRKQVNLTLPETFRLCVRGILHRLLRSLLTLAVVGLAVAFFMFLLSENAFVSSIGAGIQAEANAQRFSAQFLSRAYTRPGSLVLSRRLGAADDAGRAELARVAGWDLPRVQSLADRAASEQIYLAFFDRIPIGKNVILFQKRQGRDVFRLLAQPGAFDAFVDRLRPMLDIRVPYNDLARFRTFTDGYAQFEDELARFEQDWNAALDRLAAATAVLTGDDDLEAWLPAADDAAFERWTTLVRSAGFALAPTDAARLRDQIRAAHLKSRVFQALNTQETRELWRRTFRERELISTDAKLLRLGDPRAAQVAGSAFDATALRGVAVAEKQARRLAATEQKLAGRVAGGGALSSRQVFLLVISFLVCMVGIANAMLMSITERFREIATMKCLGATDRYILLQFMLEAALQGIAGGVLGMLTGFAIAALKGALGFGGYLLAYWPWAGILVGGIASLATGVLLAALASIYPSLAASRMAPMEAMRVE